MLLAIGLVALLYLMAYDGRPMADYGLIVNQHWKRHALLGLGPRRGVLCRVPGDSRLGPECSSGRPTTSRPPEPERRCSRVARRSLWRRCNRSSSGLPAQFDARPSPPAGGRARSFAAVWRVRRHGRARGFAFAARRRAGPRHDSHRSRALPIPFAVGKPFVSRWAAGGGDYHPPAGEQTPLARFRSIERVRHLCWPPTPIHDKVH